MEKFNENSCVRCNYSVYESVVAYCKKHLHGFTLCKNCQKWYKSAEKEITPESKKFYLALRLRGVNVELEKHDGHKHIDLAITGKGLKLNIEVDGSQHYTCPKQSFSDIQRTYHSLLKGFYTLRLPNILIRERLDETADLIVELLKHYKEQNAHNYRRKNKNEQLLKQLASVNEKLQQNTFN
jgi:very-short-patch-repair endonuclease